MLHRSLSWRHCQITVAILLAGSGSVLPAPAQAAALALADAQVSEAEQFDVPTMDLGARILPDAVRAGMRLTMPRVYEHYAIFLDFTGVSGDRDDLAINGDVEYSGVGGGLGLFYTGLPDWQFMTTTLRLSAHREKSEVDTLLSISGRQGTIDSDLYSQAISVLFSPREPLRDNGLNGYLSVGLSHDRESRVLKLDGVADNRLSRRDSQINPTAEAGLVYPTGRFRLHTVVTYHDELSLSVGLRYHLGGATGTP